MLFSANAIIEITFDIKQARNRLTSRLSKAKGREKCRWKYETGRWRSKERETGEREREN